MNNITDTELGKYYGIARQTVYRYRRGIGRSKEFYNAMIMYYKKVKGIK